jgi:hypothetical protein
VALSDYAAGRSSALSSVDLNPFVVLRNGRGAIALDALVVPKGLEDGSATIALGPEKSDDWPARQKKLDRGIRKDGAACLIA